VLPVVDHEAEIRPPVDRKCRVFEGERTENRMADVLDRLAMGAGSVVGERTRKALGWRPTGPKLIADLEQLGWPTSRCPRDRWRRVAGRACGVREV